MECDKCKAPVGHNPISMGLDPLYRHSKEAKRLAKLEAIDGRISKCKTFREFFQDKHPDCDIVVFGILGEQESDAMSRLTQCMADYADYIADRVLGSIGDKHESDTGNSDRDV